MGTPPQSRRTGATTEEDTSGVKGALGPVTLEISHRQFLKLLGATTGLAALAGAGKLLSTPRRADASADPFAIYNVRDPSYGAVGNGTTDDSTAIRNAITDAADAGGGIVCFPPGTYRVSSLPTISRPVSLWGAGSGITNTRNGGAADVSISKLLWAGGETTMLNCCRANGFVLRDLVLDGGGKATIGLLFDVVSFAQVYNVHIVNCITNCLKLVTTSMTNDDVTGNSWNTFIGLALADALTPLSLNGNSYGSPAGNTCHNAFYNLSVYRGAANGPGIYLGDSDNNGFYMVWAGAKPGATGYELEFASGTPITGPGRARSNYFFHWQGTVVARAGAYAAQGQYSDNVIFGYDRENTQAAPLIEAGARLTWSEGGGGAMQAQASMQPSNWYNTGVTIDGSDYERLAIWWNNNVPTVSVQRSGTGNARKLRLSNETAEEVLLNANNVDYWGLQPTGHFLPKADNALDLGNNSSRLRNLYLSGGLQGAGVVSAANMAPLPMAHVSHSTNQAVRNNTPTYLAFDIERYNVHNLHGADNNSRLTCQLPGKYRITANAKFAAGESGQRVLSLVLNRATEIARVQQPNVMDPTGECTLCVSQSYQLALNDYMEVVAYQANSNGASVNVVAARAYSPEFTMEWIGP